jgi:hypothetical protein
MEKKFLNKLGLSDLNAEYKLKPTGRPNLENYDIILFSFSLNGPEKNDDETFNFNIDNLVDNKDEKTTKSENKLNNKDEKTTESKNKFTGKIISNLGPQPETDLMRENFRLV